jgi:hypothetical protein
MSMSVSRSRSRSRGSVMSGITTPSNTMRTLARVAGNIASSAATRYLEDRGRSRSVNKKRKHSSDRSKAVGFNPRGIINETGKTTRDPTVKRGKRLKTGHKKAIKVSKSLKDKITKVLKTSGHKGKWMQMSYGKLFPPGDNVQSVNYGFGGNDIPVMFSFIDWLHMLSVMWNGKIDVQSPRGYNDVQIRN